MATYQAWNNGIIDYVTRGLSIGTRVFLSIDDETLETIGFTFHKSRPLGGWKNDFVEAVRGLCVYKDQVKLSRFTSPSLRDTQNCPRYVGFLALMVLAAHDMGDEQEDKPIDPKDYFTHLRRLLSLSDQEGRPKGLDRGEDEELWFDWAAWLRSHGLLPTARAGDGAYKYIQYPISQALLRKSDRNKLWRHFTQANWRKNYDEILLMQRIRRDASYLTTHLQELFNPKGAMWLQSYDAISKACYEVYEEWREADDEAKNTPSGPRLRTSLDGKIYRSEDYFSGKVSYRIFPRQVRQSFGIELVVQFRDEHHLLKEDRPGWYAPLWELDSKQLIQGLKAHVVSYDSRGSVIKNLYLPAREFWILTLDPDTPESGIYASWDKGIELGTEFVLLVRTSLQSDLARLRDEGLLEWQMDEEVFEDWREYHGVTVLSAPEMWSSINLVNEELRLSLQPRTVFSINLIGGLRAPRGSGWLVGYGPQISVAAFLPEAHLDVFDDTDHRIFSESVEAGKPVGVPFSQPGNYRVVVEQGGQSDEKIVCIVDWVDVALRSMDFDQAIQELSVPIFGTLVRD